MNMHSLRISCCSQQYRRYLNQCYAHLGLENRRGYWKAVLGKVLGGSQALFLVLHMEVVPRPLVIQNAAADLRSQQRSYSVL